MPPTIKRGIDHLVLCVRDLEAARARYRALGFTTTPRAEHPFGTMNSLVQLEGNFLELLAIDDANRISQAAPGEFGFAAYNQRFLAAREGMSMLVFESSDARADQRDFVRQGLVTYAPFDFSRAALLPDGREVMVGFSLAFVTHPTMPNAAFFCCQQHAPEHFWKPEYQRHANGANQVSEVVLVADDPGSLQPFFGALQGEHHVTRAGNGLDVRTARGRIRVCTPAEHAARFPGGPVGPAGNGQSSPWFAGYSVAVDDGHAVKQLLQQAKIPYRESSGTFQVAPRHAYGVTIEFAPLQ